MNQVVHSTKNKKMTSPLVDAEWLHNQMNQTIIILDASQKNNISNKTPKYPNKVIPGAIDVDLKRDLSDPEGAFPNTFPLTSQFQETAQRLGVNHNSTIVVYDNLGIYNSPRVWWLFKAMGHEKVYVLDGGLSAWVDAGYETSTEHSTATTKGNFIARLNSESVKSYSDVLNNISTQDCSVLDARSKGRFDGTAPEPREGLGSGHIPNSKNLPYTEVLDGEFMKSKEELKFIFDCFSLPEKPIIFSCGSGLTACIILLAASLVSEKPLSVFDGSWTEWASTEGALIEKLNT